MADSNPHEIDLSSVMGPVYWGFIVSQALGGICILQAYIYFMKSRDTPVVRAIAATMILLDLTSSALVAQSVYYYLIPHYGSLKPLNTFTFELSADCMLSTIITFVSQMFLVRQIYLLSKSKTAVFVCGVVTFGAVCVLAFGIACTMAMIVYRSSVFGNRNPKFSLFFGLQKGSSALTDIVATIALCCYLWAWKSEMKRTNSLIKNIMEVTIQRGILVTIVQNVLVIIFFVQTERLYWVAMHINLTKLYANVFFAILNSRRHLREKHYGVNVDPSSVYSEGQGRNRGTMRLIEKSLPIVTKSVVVADI